MENENANITYLIRFYNMQAGGRYRTGNEDNITSAQRALACGSVEEIKNFLVQNKNSGKKFSELMTDYAVIKGNKQKEDVAVEATKTPSEQRETNVDEVIGKTVAAVLRGIRGEEIDSRVADAAKKFMEENYGSVTRKITYEVNGERKDIGEVVHEKFEEVLQFVMQDEPVFLTGPAGSGKNHICKQIAKALGLNFYFSNAVTQEYKLTGFIDANGNYHETQFYRAFRDGGLFMLDEIDASIPEVLIILNAAIANRYFDFPCGYVEANKDFRVIAAGNTTGDGADYSYVGRTQLDAASLDRFAIVQIGYSREIEMQCAGGNEKLVSFIRAYRTAIEKNGINTTVSYRAITRIAKMKEKIGIDETLKTCLTRSLKQEDIKTILPQVSGYGEYTETLERLSK
jgi:cobaltochelatase CobS